MKVLLIMEQDRDHMISEAYELIRKAMKNEKIDLNVVDLTGKEIKGCVSCGKCVRHQGCMIQDELNTILPELKNFDGLFVLSPVIFTSLSQPVANYLESLFRCGAPDLSGKPAAGITAGRNHIPSDHWLKLISYFAQANMPVATNQYQNELIRSRDDINKEVVVNLTASLIHLMKNVSPEASGKAVKTINFVR